MATHSQNTQLQQNDSRDQLWDFLETVFTQATRLSKQGSNSETLTQNCPYNARAVDHVLSDNDISTRTVRGVVAPDDYPHPSDTGLTLEEYIEETGNGHWWVEAQLTNGTWWVVDLWSLHPDRETQPLVMAGTPTEYVPITRNPPGMTSYDP